VNTRGEVIGINTLGISSGENMGFSIPSNVAKEIAKRLEKDGKVARSWTGIKIQALKDFYSNTFTKADQGVLIADVEQSSPAKEAGVVPGDILVSVNGKPVNGEFVEQLPSIRWLLADLPAGASSEFTLERGNATVVLPVVPRIKGKIEGEDFECKRWNMTVKEINKFMNPSLYFLRKKGVFIQGVKYPGNAEDSDLRRNDVILAVDGEKIATLQDVQKVYEKTMADTEREKKVLIEVLRGGYRDWVVLDYRKDYEEEEE
jgi:S1-C subfamily serine protease